MRYQILSNGTGVAPCTIAAGQRVEYVIGETLEVRMADGGSVTSISKVSGPSGQTISGNTFQAANPGLYVLSVTSTLAVESITVLACESAVQTRINAAVAAQTTGGERHREV